MKVPLTIHDLLKPLGQLGNNHNTNNNGPISPVPFSLQELDKSFNIFNNDEFTKELNALSHLTHLTPSFCNLKSLPTTLKLPKLQHLNLAGNKINGAIPPTIANLSQLTHLDLYSNAITSLPPTITSLTTLQYLNISYNKLSTLPLQLGHLHGLKSFHCYGNPFQTPLEPLSNLKDNEALSFLRACSEGTEKFHQIKLIFLGNGREGKVKRIELYLFVEISPNDTSCSPFVFY